MTRSNLKAEIARKGYSQKEMANLLNISITTFSNKLRGINEFKSSELLLLSQLFCVSADYLLEREEK